MADNLEERGMLKRHNKSDLSNLLKVMHLQSYRPAYYFVDKGKRTINILCNI